MRQAPIFTTLFLYKKIFKAIVIASFVFAITLPVIDNTITLGTLLKIDTAYAEGGDGGGGDGGGASGGDGSGGGGGFNWPHTIDTNANISVTATSPSGATVHFPSLPVARQYVDDNHQFFQEYIPVTCNPPSAGVFPIGNTTVTCQATSRYTGQTVYSYFTVAVTSPATPTVTASITPNTIRYGENFSSMTFNSANATYCNFYQNGALAQGGNGQNGEFPYLTYTWNNIGPYYSNQSWGFECFNSVGVSSGVSTVTLTVLDNIPPVITINGSNPVILPVGSTYVDAGATAIDNLQGDITSVMSTVNNVNTSVIGSYTVVYYSTDSAGNSTSATRNVSVVDTIAPVITLSGANPLTVNFGTVFVDPGATASDNVNGNISSLIATTGVVNTAALGTYTRTYSVTDSSGNATTITRTVNVVDGTAPVLSINGLNPITIQGGTTYTDAGATSIDNVNGNITSAIVVTNPVNTSVLGTYSVIYSSTDTSGNIAASIRTVQVVDTIAPVITIVGSSTMNIIVGTTYIDAGATAQDSFYGTITGSIVTVNNVNSNAIGTYTVTYNVTDGSLNAATQVVRTVNVIAIPDTTAPTDPIASSSSHTQNATSSVTTGIFDWTTSTDAGSGVAGYSFVLDTFSGTIPDNTVDTAAITTTQTLTLGVTYYFHVKALDVAGNSSATSHIGPYIITDSQVSIVNSTINGTFYTVFSPSIASSTTLFITGSSTISNSTLLNSTIANSIIIQSNFTTSTSTLSTIITSTSTNSTITASNVTNSILLNANIASSTVNGSTINGTTISSSTVSTSTINGGSITGSTVSSSTLNNAIVSSSTLNGTVVLGSGTTIFNSNVGSTTLTNATIINNVILSGTVTLPNGTTVTITTPTPLASVINYAPVAGFSATSTGLLSASFTDLTTDSNEGTTLPDSWSYTWNFGDSSFTGGTFASTTNDQTHTYTSAGTYAVTLTVTDQYGLTSTATGTVTVVNAPITFSIVSSATGTGTGSITPTGTTTVNLGGNQTYTITPSATSTFLSLTIDGSPVATTTSFTFTNINANHTIDATFGTTTAPVPPTFTIVSTISSGTGVGTIAPVGTTTVAQGANQTYTITPNGTSTILSLTVDGVSVATSTSYTFTNVTSNHTIDVVFGNLATPTFSITSSATGPGTITPTGSLVVAQGANQTYTITANASSTLTGLVVDGVATTTTNSFTFTNVLSAHTIAAIFATTTLADTTPPVITILGLNPVSIVVGTTYVDAGATATDNVDGNITANIVTTNNIATSTPGTYTVTYTVSDAAGNGATSTRTVNVLATADVTPPVITVVGSSTVSAVVNTSYVDAGATAFDNVDGNITANIVTTNNVDITTIGSYSVIYNVTDSSGNAATSTRTVNIIAQPAVDTIPPSAPVITGVTTTATTTLGATLSAVWTDSVDNSGALAGYSFVWDGVSTTNPDTIVEGQATTSVVTLPNGTWYLHVVAVDLSLNVSTPTSTFGPIVINNLPAGDIIPPVGPTFATSTTHTIGVTSSTTAISMNWDTATDNVALAGYSYLWDTSTTTTPDNTPETTLTTLNTNLPNGTWYFHIRSVDTSGNISTSTVDFGPISIATTTTDVTPPIGPTIITSSSHTISVASINQSVITSWDTATDDTVLAGYSYVWDTFASTTPDGIPEVQATTTTTILPNGTWYFHILSADVAGNVSTPPVHFGPVIVNTNLSSDVTPPSAPIATIATTTPNTISAQWTVSTDNIALAGYSYVWDTNATTIPDAIVETQGTTTLTTVADGIWYFHIVAVDSSLNSSTPATHAGPIKIDTTAPVITLLGATTTAIVVGNVYTDAGATATDNIDGNLTANIVASSSVNFLVAGTYTVTYNVTDSSGNVATQVTRTVHVLASPDVTPPVITLLGSNPINVILGSLYTDAGVLATDNIDGNITANVTTANPVNTSVLGTYTVTYSVTDSSSNTATSSRTVNVISPTSYTLFSSVVGNGTITPTGTSTVIGGTNQTYTITPNAGHYLLSLIVDGSSVATSTSYTFTNISANHTISAVFVALPGGSPTFTIVATAGANGTISPNGTTTVSLGNNLAFTITPNATFVVGALTIDGVATTSANTFTFSNVTANHTINVTFTSVPADTTPPTNPIATSTTLTAGNATSSTNGVFIWTNSTDVGSGLAGYSFVLDTATGTVPDTIVDTTSTTTSATLVLGTTYYFHVLAVDVAGNVSATSHIGPFIITNSTVTIINSSINGTFYAFYAPTIASSTTLGITGSSMIVNSTTTTPLTLNNVNLNGTTVSSSTLANTNATSSTIMNSNLTGCTIVSAFVKNYSASNCNVSNSIVDPASGLNDLTGTTVTGNSQIYYSDVTFSFVQNSYIATSTITNSTLINSTSTDATIASSTINGSVINVSTVTSSNVSGSTVSNSTLANTTIATSTITNNSFVSGGSVTNATLNQATSTNSVINGGTITNSTLTNSTSTNSTVTNSTVTNSVLSNTSITGSSVSTSTITGGSVGTSTVSGSTLTNATTSGSTITNSNITNAVVTNSILNGVTVTGTSSTIIGTTLSNTTVTNAVIINGVMTSGSILLPNGTTTVVISTSTPITSLVNYAPVASFTTSASNLVVTITDTSTDANPSSLPDSWTYVWNFGDSTTATTSVSTIGNNRTKTYASAGTYTITLVVTDQYGLSSTSTANVTVSAPVVSGGGGGGGGGVYGGGYFINNSTSATTSNATSTTVAPPIGLVVTSVVSTPEVLGTTTPTIKTPTKVVVKTPVKVVKTSTTTVTKPVMNASIDAKELSEAKEREGLLAKIKKFVKKVIKKIETSITN